MNKKTPDSKFKTFLIIIAAVAFYMIALSIINFFNLPYKGIIQLLLLLIIAVSVYIFMRYNLYIYTCNIKENEIIFTSKLGEAEKLIAKINFNKVEYIAPADSEIIKNLKETFRYNAKNSFSSKGMFALVFTDEKGRISKLTFNASETLLKKLKEAGIKVN